MSFFTSFLFIWEIWQILYFVARIYSAIRRTPSLDQISIEQAHFLQKNAAPYNRKNTVIIIDQQKVPKLTCKERNLDCDGLNLNLAVSTCDFLLSEHHFPLSKHMSIFLIRQLLIGLTAPYNKISDWLFLNEDDGSNQNFSMASRI